MKILTVSNVHSRYDEFMQLFRKISSEHPMESFDRIIFLGDYLFYGKKNIEMIKILLKFKQKYKNVVFLKGNWEYFLEKVQRSPYKDERDHYFKYFVQYGQVKALQELRENRQLLIDWLDEVKKMKMYHIEGDTVYSHAGVDLEKWSGSMKLHQFMNIQDEEELLFSVDNHIAMIGQQIGQMFGKELIFDEFPYKVVFGQTAVNKIMNEDKSVRYTEPFHLGNFYGIDFGGIYAKGRIGAVIFSPEGMRTYVQDVGNAQISSKSKPETKTSVKKENTSIKQNKISTQMITYNLFKQGKSIKEISKERNLKPVTIENHLFTLYKEGKEIDITKFYKKHHEKMILNAAKIHGVQSLRTIKENVDEKINYTEIKAVLTQAKLI